MASLAGQFKGRRVKKTYLALVEGAPAEDAFAVDAPLALTLSDRAAAACASGRSTTSPPRNAPSRRRPLRS